MSYTPTRYRIKIEIKPTRLHATRHRWHVECQQWYPKWDKCPDGTWWGAWFIPADSLFERWHEASGTCRDRQRAQAKAHRATGRLREIVTAIEYRKMVVGDATTTTVQEFA